VIDARRELEVHQSSKTNKANRRQQATLATTGTSKMLFLPVYRFAADHKAVIVVAVVVYVLGLAKMTSLVRIAEERAGKSIPDVWFGIPAEQLRETYQAWGDDGRRGYVEASMIDLFPYTPSYTICMGAFLVLVARRKGWTESIANIMTVVMLLDFGESSILQYGARFYPADLPDSTIKLCSSCNQLKWILFGSAILVVLVGALLPPAKKRNERAPGNKQE